MLDVPLQKLGRFCLFNPCLVLALLLGTVRLLTEEQQRPRLAVDRNQTVELVGRIDHPPLALKRGLYLEITPLSVRQADRDLSLPGKVAVYVYSLPGGSESDPYLRYGERIRVSALLEEAPHHEIPGVDDLRLRFWQRGIAGVVRLKSHLQVQRLGPDPGWDPRSPLFSYVRSFERFCRGTLQPAQENLVLSTLLGQTRRLEEVDRIAIEKLGIFHLFAVSGFHVSLVYLFLHLLVRPLGLAGRLLALGAVWSYVVAVGAPISAIRAGLMASWIHLLLSLGLKSQFLNGLGVAALITLAVLPQSIHTASFQFSYLSLLAIGLCVLPIQPWIHTLRRTVSPVFLPQVRVEATTSGRLGRRIRFRLEHLLEPLPRTLSQSVVPLLARGSGSVLSLISCTLCIQLFTLPLALYYSNVWCWTHWLSNLVLVPCFSLFLLAAFVLLITFWLPTGEILSALLGTAADLIRLLMDLVQMIATIQYVPHPSTGELILYFLLLGLGLILGRWALHLLWLTPVLLFLSVTWEPDSANGQLEVTLLDVGQGESIHIAYPEGSHALVDTGGRWSWDAEPSRFVGQRLVGRYLWHRRIRRLSYVLLTHPHQDHVQGYEFIREAFPVEKLMVAEPPAGELPQPRLTLSAGQVFFMGGVGHRVLHPPGNGNPAWNSGGANNRSVVLLLEYGRFRLLLTGDIDRNVERGLTPRLSRTAVLKVAHHGSGSSSSSPFLNRLQPRVGLISAGRKNPFGHPSPAALQRLRRAGALPLSTSQWGSLRVRTDGMHWQVAHYRGETGSFCRIIGGFLEGEQ